MSDIENHTIELLKAIRGDIAEIKHEQEVTNLRLASMEDKLSGEVIYHLALRDEVADIKRRLAVLEQANSAA